jgi:hypothetical protein
MVLAFFFENGTNLLSKFIKSTKHLKHNKYYIEIPRPPNGHYRRQNRPLASMSLLLYRSRIDLVDDNRVIFMHVPLRTNALEP